MVLFLASIGVLRKRKWASSNISVKRKFLSGNYKTTVLFSVELESTGEWLVIRGILEAKYGTVYVAAKSALRTSRLENVDSHRDEQGFERNEKAGLFKMFSVAAGFL